MPKGQPTITWNDSNHTKLLYALLHEHREMKLDLAATASHFPDGVDENVLARRITKIKAAMNDNSATIMGSFDAGGANAPATPTSKARRKKLTLKKVVEDKEDGSADVDDSPTKKRKLSKVVVEEVKRKSEVLEDVSLGGYLDELSEVTKPRTLLVVFIGHRVQL